MWVRETVVFFDDKLHNMSSDHYYFLKTAGTETTGFKIVYYHSIKFFLDLVPVW